MNIGEYIKWNEIWEKEIHLDADDYENERKAAVEQFNFDKTVALDFEECELQDDGNMIFVWNESGGQNESDTQGWYRIWWLEFDSDCLLVSINYEQG